MNAFIQFIYISKSSLLRNELLNQFESMCERIYDAWVMISSLASLLISIVLIFNLQRDWNNQSSINLCDCTNYLFLPFIHFPTWIACLAKYRLAQNINLVLCISDQLIVKEKKMHLCITWHNSWEIDICYCIPINE